MTVRRLDPSLAHHLVNTLGWSRLRPLQEEAVEPVLAGSDALLLAPTAGGKTEAAIFPLLTAMAADGWPATSVLYVCPLKALLNNLLPRLETYAAWVGRRVAVWHGDIAAARRKAITADPPDILLTTPESIESMLVSTNVDHRRLFGGLRAIVVDEVHAFAGDDRGWHLLAVLERLTRIAGRPIQRIGLSATVGNPDELLGWLQGSGRDARPRCVVAPESQPAYPSQAAERPGHGLTDTGVGDVQLDHVASVANAAAVIAAVGRGEKRLVFCDSRHLVERLGAELRGRGVTTFLSHASLSTDERRRAETAFAEARDCVIVATSTLELGIDVGDLDRVIQVNAPPTVSAFLQRLGRTGRRPGAVRNCLFLALSHEAFLQAAALTLLWGRGYVEPVAPPPQPRHIVAQQLLAVCLQERRVGDALWEEWWAGLDPFGPAARPIVAYLVDQGYLDRDGGMLFVGRQAERRFGRRHFMELTSVFTAAPEFTVLSGRTEVGRVDPALLAEHVDGPRLLLLAGQSWRVTWIDWTRRRCTVEPAEDGGVARWVTPGAGGLPHALTRAMRDVLLGADPPATLTRRGVAALATLREQYGAAVHPDCSIVGRGPQGDVRWWTWAGYRANATVKSTLPGLVDDEHRVCDTYLRLRADLTVATWRDAIRDAARWQRQRLRLPEVDDKALRGLKFASALPDHLARATLAVRLADLDGAAAVLAEPHRLELGSGYTCTPEGDEPQY